LKGKNNGCGLNNGLAYKSGQEGACKFGALLVYRKGVISGKAEESHDRVVVLAVEREVLQVAPHELRMEFTNKNGNKDRNWELSSKRRERLSSVLNNMSASRRCVCLFFDIMKKYYKINTAQLGPGLCSKVSKYYQLVDVQGCEMGRSWVHA
jgi:hypothetical protein